MARLNPMGPVWTKGLRRGSGWLLLGAMLALTSACVTPPGQADATSRDLLEIKDQVNRLVQQSEASNRKQEYAISSLNDTVTSRIDGLQQSVDQMQQLQQQQQQDMQTLHGQVEGLAIRSNTQAAPAPAEAPAAAPTPAPFGQAAAPAPTPAPTPAAAPAATQTLDEAFKNAKALADSGKYAEAIEGYRQALNLSPEPAMRTEILFAMADAQFNNNDLSSSEQTYKEMIKINNTSPKAWAGVERLSDIYAKQNRSAEAAKMLQMIATNYPQYPDISRVRTKLQNLGGSAGQ